MIVKTEAFVLSSMKYGDTSKIVRLYTREFGKLSVIAKGARNNSSKFRASLEPMSYVSAVIYKSASRELQLLSQCDIIRSFPPLWEDLEKMYVGMSAVELVAVATHDEQPHEQVFVLLLDVLENAALATKTSIVALYFFETQLADLLGFRPDLQRCASCGRALEAKSTAGMRFSMTRSGALCSECTEFAHGVTISAGTLRILQRLQEVNSAEAALSIALSSSNDEEIRESLRLHYETHVEGFRRLRSEQVFSRLLSRNM